MSIPLMKQGLRRIIINQCFQTCKSHVGKSKFPAFPSGFSFSHMAMKNKRFSVTGQKLFSTDSGNANVDNEDSQEFDIIIAGGGMVGSALACSLGKEKSMQDIKILVLEAGPYREPIESLPDEYSNRVSAITPGSKRLLQSIGAWDHIVELRQKPFSKMHVWDSCGAGHITFDAAENEDVSDDEESHMAHIIENSVILSAVAKELMHLDSSVQVEYESRIKDIKFPFTQRTTSNGLVSVQLEDGTKFKTKLLVGADGFNSIVRKKANMEYFRHDYDQTAVVATLHLEQEILNDVAWQRFLPNGPIAMLPLSENRSSLVWSTTETDAKALMKLPKETFVDAVNSAFWEDVDRHPLVEASSNWFQNVINIMQPGNFSGSQLESPPAVCDINENSRAMYPLGLGHALQYANHRLVLVGDAAHRIHPLAGQGVNLGTGDVACLRDVLVDAILLGEDIGDLDHLLVYETRRQREVIPMMSAVDALKKLFSTTLPPVVLARTLGLQATNAMKPLKDQIMKHAMK